MSRPTKAQLKARKQAARNARRAERQIVCDPDEMVVCDKCGFVQPYTHTGQGDVYPEPDVWPCIRGEVLGEDLECDSLTCTTIQAWEEAA